MASRATRIFAAHGMRREKNRHKKEGRTTKKELSLITKENPHLNARLRIIPLANACALTLGLLLEL
jgi:hypothetical protein